VAFVKTIWVIFVLSIITISICHAEPVEEYRGTLGKRQVSLNISEYGSLGYVDCHSGPYITRLRNISKYKAEIIFFSDVYYEKPDYKITVSRSKALFRGIQVEKYEGENINIDGKIVDLSVLGSVDPKYLTWTGTDASCLHVGWEPELLRAVIDVNATGKAKSWARQHNANFRTSPDRPLNEVSFFVPVGSEEENLAELRKQPWILDARRYGIGAGPDFAYVDYKLGSVYVPGESQEVVRRKLWSVIKKSFPDAAVNERDFTAKRGLSYNLTLFQPVSKLGLDLPELEGYWLKANISVLVNRQLSDDNNGFDHLEVEIRDGWLPRWPSNSTTAPPSKHTRQFHLEPEGDDNKRNFYVLEKLQANIASSLSAEWGGEAQIPTSE
jgi:hypothetical protein